MYPVGHGQPLVPGPGPVGPPVQQPTVGSGTIGVPLPLGPSTGPAQTLVPSPLTTLGGGLPPIGTILSPQTTLTGSTGVLSPVDSGSPTLSMDQPHFTCPRRPNLGREGRSIQLRANHFQVIFIV